VGGDDRAKINYLFIKKTLKRFHVLSNKKKGLEQKSIMNDHHSMRLSQCKKRLRVGAVSFDAFSPLFLMIPTTPQ